MTCICNKPFQRLCNTPSCTYPAQLCDNKACSVFQRHGLCGTVLLDQYTSIDRAIARNEKAFAERLEIVMNELVEEIKYKENLRVKRRNFQKIGKLIKKLRKDKRNKSNFISGKEVAEAQEEILQLRKEDSKIFFERSLKEFVKKFEEIKQKIVEEREKYFEKRMDEEQSSEQRGQVEIVYQPAEAEDKNRQTTPPSIKIRGKTEEEITDFLTLKDKEFIRNSFTEKEVINIKKIYTASTAQNNFSPEIYYKKCGNLRNTLIVVKYRHKNSSVFENHYFAAFTPLRLGHEYYNHRTYQNDPEFLSKLFWVDERMVFPLKKEDDNKAIFIDKDYGLCYGNDLLIKFKGQDINMITIGSKYETGHLTKEQAEDLKDYAQKMRIEGKVYDYQVYQVEFRQ